MDLRGARFDELLAAVASKQPAPGGGAVAASVGALASALGAMVVAYSSGKKSLAAHQRELEADEAALTATRALLLDLAREDAEAYGAVSELMKLDKSDPRRTERMPAASEAALRAPQSVVAACADLLRRLEALAGRSNKWLHSDLAISAILAESAARSASWMVRVNLPLYTEVHGADAAARAREETDASLASAARSLASVLDACAASVGGA